MLQKGVVMDSRKDRKAAAILAAARQHFYSDGYGATSVDAIGAAAGIGKATIYKYFGSKEKLFAAVVAQENRHGLDEIRMILTREDGSVSARLTKAADALLDLLIAPDFIASYRMIMAEATRFPELAELYYEGAIQLLGTLSDSIATLATDGDLNCPDSRRAAEQFVGLIRGDLQLRALLGFPSPGTEERRAIVDAGVGVFYCAYRPSGSLSA